MQEELLAFLIDDDLDDQEFFAMVIEETYPSIQYTFATDGVQALEKLNENPSFVPNIILIDVNMPRLNGLELLTWLRTQPEFGHLMVIVLTGQARIESINHAYHLGANSYLVKPVRHEELLDLIQCFYRYWVIHNHLPSPPAGTVPHPLMAAAADK